MSYKSLMKHRCTLLDMMEIDDDGSVLYDWGPATGPDGTPLTNVRCFLDLNFIRRGKDTQWMEAAGRPQDRAGVIFFLPGTPVKAGQRIKMQRGPQGTFKIEGAIDEAWTPEEEHHLEIGVIEVATVLTRPGAVQG